MPGFGAEIATAFVRIRPNMAGFKSETESGVKSAFSGLAKIAGVALGAGAAFEFGKGLISDAANLQKSVETVNALFGQAAARVREFADGAGIGFGIATHASEATAAKFGILFNNLGIGRKEAAGMTVGLLKLAGSLSAIRGVDPNDVLNRLPLALAGNLRSLKQLGVAVDASQIKIAAFKLGLISSVKDAITPAIKAQAIYSLATARLPYYLELAKKHSGDFVNVQRRLSAEWDRSKEIIGTALLPTFTHLIAKVDAWFSRMQKSGALQHDFNAIARTTVSVVHGIVSAVSAGFGVWKEFSKAVGGTKSALVTLLAVMAISKIRAISGAIVSDLVNNGFRQLRIATETEKVAYVEAFGTMEIATIGLGATIKSALISTGIGALVVAIGIAVAYVITHWAKVKRFTVALGKAIVAVWQGLKITLIGIAEVIGGAMTTQLTAPLRALLKIGGFLGGLFDKVFGTNIKGSLDKATKFIDTFSTNLVTKGARNVKEGVTKGFHDAASAWSDALSKSSKDPKVIAGLRANGSNFGDVVSKAAADTVKSGAAGVAGAVGSATANAVAAAQKRIAAAVTAAKTNLDSIGGKLADTINKILQKLGGTGGALAGSPQGQAFKKLRDLVASGAPSFEIARAEKALSSQLENVGKTPAQTVKQRLADLTEQFNKGHIGAKTFNARVNEILRENGINYKNAGKAGGKAFADAFRAQVEGLREQAGAIAAVPARLRGIGGGGGDATIKIVRPLEVMRQQDARIAATASKERGRIAKATEKAAATLHLIQTTKVAPLPGFGKTPPGHASKKAKTAANAGLTA